jgi:hypothetical protein
MTAQDENVIVTCGAVVIAVTTARDFLPPERGGLGTGFEPKHLLGGMAATTLLLLAGEGAPELAKAFAVMTATVAFLYGGANILETFFFGEEQKRSSRRERK